MSYYGWRGYTRSQYARSQYTATYHEPDPKEEEEWWEAFWAGARRFARGYAIAGAATVLAAIVAGQVVLFAERVVGSGHGQHHPAEQAQD